MGGARFADRTLPVLVALMLLASWWLSLIVLVNTPFVDLTPPKVVVLAGTLLGAVLVGRRVLSLALDPAMVVFAALITWFPIAAVLRGSSADLKTTLGYLVFCGGAALVAYLAARLSPSLAARVLIGTVIAATVVSFLAAGLERATFPLPDQPDSLEWLWSIFRPPVGMDDPRLGYIDPPPIHSPTGEPGVVRATGFFVQTNYLAFFCVLAVPLAMSILLTSLRNGRRIHAIAAGALLAIAVLTGFWTYARVGLVALVVIALATAIVEWVVVRQRRRDRPARSSLWPTLTALVVVGAILVGSFAFDGVGLSRMTGSALGDGGSPTDPADPVGQSADRSATIRLELQAAATELITRGPRELLIGPGLATFETAVHDPTSELHLPDAVGIRDPNSMWLTVALAGGLIAVALLVALLAVLVISLARAARRAPDGPLLVASIWLLAWLPVWALVQFLGTNPFNTSESIIFGTLVGSMAGISAAVARMGESRSGQPNKA